MCKYVWACAWVLIGATGVYTVQGFHDAMLIQNCKLMHTTFSCKIVDTHAEPVYNDSNNGGEV